MRTPMAAAVLQHNNHLILIGLSMHWAKNKWLLRLRRFDLFFCSFSFCVSWRRISWKCARFAGNDSWFDWYLFRIKYRINVHSFFYVCADSIVRGWRLFFLCCFDVIVSGILVTIALCINVRIYQKIKWLCGVHMNILSNPKNALRPCTLTRDQIDMHTHCNASQNNDTSHKYCLFDEPICPVYFSLYLSLALSHSLSLPLIQLN